MAVDLSSKPMKTLRDYKTLRGSSMAEYQLPTTAALYIRDEDLAADRLHAYVSMADYVLNLQALATRKRWHEEEIEQIGIIVSNCCEGRLLTIDMTRVDNTGRVLSVDPGDRVILDAQRRKRMAESGEAKETLASATWGEAQETLARQEWSPQALAAAMQKQEQVKRERGAAAAAARKQQRAAAEEEQKQQKQNTVATRV